VIKLVLVLNPDAREHSAADIAEIVVVIGSRSCLARKIMRIINAIFE
jgi:Zn finger protein HypA/HybF involved in hydrogenase expression